LGELLAGCDSCTETLHGRSNDSPLRLHNGVAEWRSAARGLAHRIVACQVPSLAVAPFDASLATSSLWDRACRAAKINPAKVPVIDPELHPACGCNVSELSQSQYVILLRIASRPPGESLLKVGSVATCLGACIRKPHLGTKRTNQKWETMVRRWPRLSKSSSLASVVIAERSPTASRIMSLRSSSVTNCSGLR
jgi:hypothetical protein